MTRIHISLALGGLALGLAVPAIALSSEVAPAIVDDDPEEKKKDDEKPKTVTVWILEAKGPS